MFQPVSRALPALTLALAAVAPAQAHGQAWETASPDGRTTAELSHHRPYAPPVLTVKRDGVEVLRTPVGLRLDDRPRALRFVSTRSRHVTEVYETPSGKRRRHRLDARELTVMFRRGRRGPREGVQLRASDDGVAYRHLLRDRRGLTIVGERAGFQLPPGSRLWLQPYRSNYESPYEASPLESVAPGEYGFPVLVETPAGSWVLLSESGVTGRHSAARVQVAAGSPARLGLGFADTRLRASRRHASPWRIAVIGGLDRIVGSDLALSHGPRSRVAAPTWVRPGRAAWSWWSGGLSASNFERQRDFVDYAAARGWEYVLVDFGWDGGWVPSLVRYAAQRGVGILLWARWSDLARPRVRDELLDRWKAWGVAGVKLDFMQSDRRERMRWYHRTAAAAARRQLLVNFHGSTLPRGMERTWPNVLTFEGVIGAEAYRGSGTLAPDHNVVLPFTRNAVGPMDYTPVTFSAERRQTTAAHELALTVVFESGLQHFADSPESYRKWPLAERLLEQVPAAWDDTILIEGHPDRSVTIARRDGERWYVAGIAGAQGASVSADLDFLPAAKLYDLVLIEDSGRGLRRTSRPVTGASRLELELRPGGGFVATVDATTVPSPAPR